MPILDLDDTIIRVIIVIIIVFITTLITGRIAKYMKKTEKFSENMTAHFFQECTTGALDEYATIEQTFAPSAPH